MSKHIVIIDDEKDTYESIKDIVSPEVYDISSVVSFREAQDIFEANRDSLIAVVIDANVSDGGVEEACQLIQKLRLDDFKGPIIAASSSRSACRQMVDAGCNYTVDGEKYRVPDELVKALNDIAYGN